MNEKTHVFKDWEVPLVSLRLQMENNALLRTILANQLTIMDKLKMDTTFPYIIFNDVVDVVSKIEIPSNANAELLYEKYIEELQKVVSFLHDRAWEYAQLSLSKTDEPPEDEK